MLRGHDDDGTVTVQYRGVDIVRYRAVTAASKPHVDRLGLPPDAGPTAGHNLVLAGAHDHPWHLGAFFAPKFVDGVNCWASETEEADGRAVGRGHDVTCRGETLTVEQSVEWRTDDEPLLADERTVTVDAGVDRGYLLTWAVTVEALGADREFAGADTDRGSYGGFSLRFGREMADGAVRLPDADDPEDRSGPTGAYCDYTGPLDGRRGSTDPWRAGCTVLLDAAPGAPEVRDQRWFVARRYPFVGANPAWGKPVEISRGERRRWRWGVWVHGGKPDRDEIERVHGAFLDG